MGDIKQKNSFEKAFKAAVPNSEGKIWFKHPSKSYQQRKVCFMLDGKETFVGMYMSHDSIAQWKEYFIELIEDGKFDKTFYCQVYGDKLPAYVTNKVHRFPMTETSYDKFYCHNPDAMKMLNEVRSQYGDAGMETVPKPPTVRTKLVCTNCGSDNVHTKAWVNANTNEYVSDISDGETEDNWCDNCKGHHKLEQVSK